VNESTIILSPLLQRLLAGATSGSERLTADLQKGARALASLSLNYNGHSIRAGIHGAMISAIDAELDRAAMALSRVLFDLQQRLLLDVQALTRLSRIESVVDLEDERPLDERVREHLDEYTATLGASLNQTRTTVTDIVGRLRILANNTEIAACQESGTTGAPVELFMAIAGQMRTLAARLRTIADDLAIFEQIQLGHAEAVRQALYGPTRGANGDASDLGVPAIDGSTHGEAA
jgi:hypothetical protein